MELGHKSAFSEVSLQLRPDDPLELLEAQLDKFRVAERTAMDDGGQNGIRTPRSAARAGATRRAFFAEGKISRRSVRRSVGQ